jgi:hypothetical protein
MNDTPYSETHCSKAQETRLKDDYEDTSSDASDGIAAQSIFGSYIDSGKLTTLLRTKFGAGAYNIRVSIDNAKPVEGRYDGFANGGTPRYGGTLTA